MNATSRITAALAYLAAEVSCSRDEFRRDNQPAGDMLLQAVLSSGYVVTRGDRLALSPMGQRRVQAEAPVEDEVE